jgi:hypothetical protein
MGFYRAFVCRHRRQREILQSNWTRKLQIHRLPLSFKMTLSELQRVVLCRYGRSFRDTFTTQHTWEPAALILKLGLFAWYVSIISDVGGQADGLKESDNQFEEHLADNIDRWIIWVTIASMNIASMGVPCYVGNVRDCALILCQCLGAPSRYLQGYLAAGKHSRRFMRVNQGDELCGRTMKKLSHIYPSSAFYPINLEISSNPKTPAP